MIKNHYIKICVMVTLLVLLYGGGINVAAKAMDKKDAEDKRILWDQIRTLHHSAKQLLSQESELLNEGKPVKEVRAERRAIGKKAVTLLENYITKYVTDKNSLTYLRTTYRMALYLEVASDYKAAIDKYEKCTKHPLLNNPQALFNKQALAPLVYSRLDELHRAMKQIAERQEVSSLLKKVAGGYLNGDLRDELESSIANPHLSQDVEP